MKLTKKVGSLLLAMVMMLALAVPGMAATSDDDGYSITINGAAIVAGQEYAAYQIFKGVYSTAKETLSDIEWGSGIDTTRLDEDGKLGGKTAVEWAESLGDTESYSEGAKSFAALVGAALSGTTAATAIAENGKVVLGGLSDGYYLVKTTKINENNGETYTEYMLEVAGRDTDATVKAGTIEPDKKIVEDGKEVEVNDAAIGGIVTYRIKATLPDNYTSYKQFFLKFVDTLSVGLDYVEITGLTIESKNDAGETTTKNLTFTDFFTVSEDSAEKGDNDPTVITIVPKNDTKDLKLAFTGDNALKNGDKIIIEYTARVNEKAVIEDEGNPNELYLIYSTDPNTSWTGDPEEPENPDDPTPKIPVGETPKKEVRTFVTEIEIDKVTSDGAGGYKPLEGAKFKLTGTAVETVLIKSVRFEKDNENGTYYELKNGSYTEEEPITEGDDMNVDLYVDPDTKYVKVDVEEYETRTKEQVVEDYVGENGILKFTGLMAGDYELTETETPDGYNTMNPNPLKFTISFDEETKKFSVNVTNSPDFKFNETSEGKFVMQVVNNSGTQLPETGGIGTTIFTVSGVVLMLGAAILFISKKRTAND